MKQSSSGFCRLSTKRASEGTAEINFRRLLLIHLSKSRRNDQGNIVLSLIVVFSLLIGTLAVLQRASGSNIGSFFSSKGRGSRDAAEYGIKYLISEFASPQNRKLSVIGASPSSWSTLSTAAVVNPCLGAATRPSSDILAAATSITTVPGSSNKQFFLKSIVYLNDSASGSRNSVGFSRANGSSAFQASTSTGSYSSNSINIAGVNRGYLKITVVGQETGLLGAVLSSTELTREFEIVPKCCQRSFGYTFLNPSSPQASHGNDLRSCPAFGLGNLNLVVGGNGNGVFSAAGKSYDLWKGALNVPQDIAITLNPGDQQVLLNSQSTDLIYSTTELPPQINTDLNAPAIAGSGCINDQNVNNANVVTLPNDGLSGSVVGNCTSSTTSQNVPVWQEGADAQGRGRNASCTSGEILGRDLPSNAIIVDSDLRDISGSPSNNKCYLPTTRVQATTTPDPYCKSVLNTNGSTEYYCLIRHIDMNGKVLVDSTGGKVNLLFYDAVTTNTQGNSDILGGTVKFNGGSNSGFEHIFGGATATIANADRFAVYNNILGSDFQLYGAAGALSGFFDLRFSDVELRGGGANENINLSGILWTNNLTLRGNLTFVNPASGPCTGNPNDFAAGSTCAILASLYPELFDGNASNDEIRPAFDWVPRSVFTSTMH